jgi:hypothetical protein
MCGATIKRPFQRRGIAYWAVKTWHSASTSWLRRRIQHHGVAHDVDARLNGFVTLIRGEAPNKSTGHQRMKVSIMTTVALKTIRRDAE